MKGDYEDKLGELASLQDSIAAGEKEMEGLKQEYEGKLKELGDQYAALQDEYEGNRGKIAQLGSQRLRISGERLARASGDNELT